MEVPVQSCIVATKDVQLPIVAKGWVALVSPWAAPEWLDNPARYQSWCQNTRMDCK